MKKYVIFTNNIEPLGGQQYYTLGKANYLERRGWDVKVISTSRRDTKCEISSLNKYVCMGFIMMQIPPYLLPKKHLNSIKREMLKIIDCHEGDICYIESQYDKASLWAELIAKEIQGNHIVFDVGEKYRQKGNLYEKCIEFYKFKFDRNELFGNAKETLKMLFDGYYDVEAREEYVFEPIEPGNVLDVDDSRVDNIVKADYVICLITRAEKGYFVNAIEGVRTFADAHMEKSISFVLVGDTTVREAELKRVFDDASNVTLCRMGNMVPIPRSLFSKIDVVIAGSICAELAVMENVYTIVMDADSFHAYGVLGYDTNNSLYSNGTDKPYEEYLEDVLIKRKYDSMENKYVVKKPDDEYEKQTLFFDKSSEEKEYYDILSYTNNKELDLARYKLLKKVVFKEKIKKLLGIGLIKE